MPDAFAGPRQAFALFPTRRDKGGELPSASSRVNIPSSKTGFLGGDAENVIERGKVA